jgi:DNA-binding NtrC family response regulator
LLARGNAQLGSAPGLHWAEEAGAPLACREELAEQLGIDRNTLKARLRKMTIEQAMSTPIDKSRKKNGKTRKTITHNGVTKNISNWARDLKISTQALNFRIKNWGLEKALETEKQVKYDRFS